MAGVSGSFTVNIEKWLAELNVKLRVFFQDQAVVANLVSGSCKAKDSFPLWM
jgi:hypothetical protein